MSSLSILLYSLFVIQEHDDLFKSKSDEKGIRRSHEMSIFPPEIISFIAFYFACYSIGLSIYTWRQMLAKSQDLPDHRHLSFKLEYRLSGYRYQQASFII